MEESFHSKIGKDIEMAVEEALIEGRTKDLQNPEVKTLSTKEMGDLISEKLKTSLKK